MVRTSTAELLVLCVLTFTSEISLCVFISKLMKRTKIFFFLRILSLRLTQKMQGSILSLYYYIYTRIVQHSLKLEGHKGKPVWTALGLSETAFVALQDVFRSLIFSFFFLCLANVDIFMARPFSLCVVLFKNWYLKN